MASRLLVAVLSIPLPPPQTESDKYLMFDEVAREKSRRLATLLSLQTVPTRKKLVSDLVSVIYNILDYIKESREGGRQAEEVCKFGEFLYQSNAFRQPHLL